ncbi:hypothetical protein SARC_06444 [Sphaeroforma arctica JP610]|uniref:Uncharacterized protein n=1 Tax=Sphaeroforma arctica JP610 TaxID=667725 RepID=A0A0L0FXD9_9EUKA|nr:hypothetical protein SARC_06444 [Sphaeroforma arctica JP610]KNC81216.1 hypothetical protein SARC_06444 [Sphaeroforma arctica JP610]|eukprot:XP_014155118.1 hypothetical protein SARC_06444 [Sphaeroforma arctica JP610]
MISKHTSNWDTNSQKSEFINNHDLETLSRSLNAFPVMLETNDIALQQWISALIQSFNPEGIGYQILQKHLDELDRCHNWHEDQVSSKEHVVGNEPWGKSDQGYVSQQTSNERPSVRPRENVPNMRPKRRRVSKRNLRTKKVKKYADEKL